MLGLLLPIGVTALAIAGYALTETANIASVTVLAPLIVGGLAAGCVVALGDFARIFFVHDPGKRFFACIRDAVELLVRNAGAAVPLVLVLGALSFLPLLGVVLFEELVPPAPGNWLVPLVLVQQFAVLLRAGARVLALAAQSSLLRDTTGALRFGDPLPSPSPLLSRGV
jgi:hypothetical protein